MVNYSEVNRTLGLHLTIIFVIVKSADYFLN